MNSKTIRITIALLCLITTVGTTQSAQAYKIIIHSIQTRK
jgi:hypothetical protein